VKSVDIYFNRKYNPKNYNCAHLVAEVWKDLTGQDISETISGALTNLANRDINKIDRTKFRKIDTLQDPCIVLLWSSKRLPHCGIYLRERFLHITPQGVKFQLPEIALFGYAMRRFYICR